jgi:hypothetical protein
MDGWIGVHVQVDMCGWVDPLTDCVSWMSGWMDGWMLGQVERDAWIEIYSIIDSMDVCGVYRLMQRLVVWVGLA